MAKAAKKPARNIVGDLIHATLRDVAQTIYDEYGVQIEYAMIGWVDVSSHDKPAQIVGSVQVETITK